VLPSERPDPKPEQLTHSVEQHRNAATSTKEGNANSGRYLSAVTTALAGPWATTGVLVLLALIASIQAVLLGNKTYMEGGAIYTHYNNYVIFKQSFVHLMNGLDLYVHYPAEQWDLYKYSPTFAMVFGVFALFPDAVGLSLWNMLNAAVLLAAVYYLPKFSMVEKSVALLLCAPELMTSMQNAQSNALIAGLLVLAFGLLERKHYFWAVGCIIISAYIKVFGIVGLALFALYPQRLRLVGYTVAWALALFVAPLLVTNMAQLKLHYLSWGNMMANDHSASLGYSVMGCLTTWFGPNIDKLKVLLVGVVLFLLPYLRFGHYRDARFRLLALVSVLLWVVIFNHKAESPTFIIAMAGVVIWYFASERRSVDGLMLVCALVLTSLSATDLIPSIVRTQVVEPYALKAVPCIIIWCMVVYDMLFKPTSSPVADQT